MSQQSTAEPQRLAKRLAAQLPCSRSDTENYIAGGWVRVDGVVAEEPVERVRDDQKVLLDPKAELEPLESMTLIWHTPATRVLPDEPLLPDALAAKWFTNANRFKGVPPTCGCPLLRGLLRGLHTDPTGRFGATSSGQRMSLMGRYRLLDPGRWPAALHRIALLPAQIAVTGHR